MKSMFKMNKKGFTLVELLAVIVILALLIVITANTVLPMLSSSKESGMLTYAERVMSKAATQYQADSLAGLSTSNYGTLSTDKSEAYYSIQLLMGSDEYFGCVMYDNAPGAGETNYKIVMYNSEDKLKIQGYSTNGLIKKPAGAWLDWASAESFASSSYDIAGECTASNFSTSIVTVDLNSAS